MDTQTTNNKQDNQEMSVWKKYFSGWNFVINALIASIPASLVIGILRELGIRGALVMVGILWGFIYLAGLIREKISGNKKITFDNKEIKEHKPKDKKKIWLVILLVGVGLVIAIFIFSNNSENLSGKDFELPKTEKSATNYEQAGDLYRNTKYGFRIIFPENWEQKDGDGPNILRKAVNGNHSINIGVKEFPKEFEGENFNIKDLFTLEEYKQTTVEGIKEKFSNAKIINYGETQIDNQSAYWTSYETPYSVLDISVNGIMIQYQVVYNNTFYFITIGSTKDEFSGVEGILKKSVSTFVFEGF